MDTVPTRSRRKNFKQVANNKVELVFEEIKKGLTILNETDEVVIIMDDTPKLIGPSFILIYVDNGYIIYFEVDAEPNYSAEIIKTLMLFIKPYDLLIGNNFFHDPDTKKTVFGRAEAKEAKIAWSQTKRGKIQCPVCESYYNKELINKDGICVICKKHVMDNIIFH